MGADGDTNDLDQLLLASIEQLTTLKIGSVISIVGGKSPTAVRYKAFSERDNVVIIECLDEDKHSAVQLFGKLENLCSLDTPVVKRARALLFSAPDPDPTTVCVAIASMIQEITITRALLIRFENCDDSDPLTLALIEELGRLASQVPVLVMCNWGRNSGLSLPGTVIHLDQPSRGEKSDITELHTLIQDARKLRIQGAPEQSVRLLDSVDPVSLSSEDAKRLYIERGTARLQIGDLAALTDYESAYNCAVEPNIEDVLRVAHGHFQLGQVTQALGFLERQSAKKEFNPQVLDVAWGNLARFNLKSRDDAKLRLESALEKLTADNKLSFLGGGLLSELAFEKVAKVEYGIGAVDRLLVEAEGELNFADTESLAWFWCAYTAHVAGHNLQAIRILNRVIEVARTNGYRTQFVQAMALRSGPLFHLGYLDEAAADAEIACIAAQSPQQFVVPATRGALVQMRVWMNDPTGAAELVAQQDASDASNTGADMLYLYGKALQRFHSRRSSSAISALERARELQSLGDGDNPAMIPWASLSSEIYGQLGDHTRAQQLADDEALRAVLFGSPGPIGIALRAQGIAGNIPDVDVLKESVAQHELGERRIEHVQSLISLGEAIGSTHPKDARPILKEAMGLASKMRARKLSDEAKKLLVSHGGRPRREALEGLDAITAAEHRVLALAMSGLSNRQIAEHLFITLKSVEWHLTSSYRKLKVKGRGEARELIATQGLRSSPVDLS